MDLTNRMGKANPTQSQFQILLIILLVIVPVLALGQEVEDQKNPEGEPKAGRTEWAVLPIIAGDTDIGFSFGTWFQVTRFEEGYKPHRWQMPAQFKMSVKDGPDGAEFPTHDHFIRFDLPGLLDGNFRITPRVFYYKAITDGYYGLGNDSQYIEPDEDDDEAARRNQFKREVPGARILLRYTISDNFSIFTEPYFGYQQYETYPGSLLEEQFQAGDDEIFGKGDNALLQLILGAAYDSRDHEVVPTRGMFHDISVRGSSGKMTGADHDYWGANVTTRFYFPLLPPYLVPTARVMGDLLQGDVPLHLLSRSEGIQSIRAPGGKNAIRGVPAGRYHGKVKVLADVELRSMFYRFNIGSADFALGAAAFFDTGRIWADLEENPDLDGDGLGLKFGTGGGPRIQWGESVIIRLDFAYSPVAAEMSDDFPLGIYLETGEAF